MIGLNKRREIEITNKTEFEAALTKIIELLRDNAFTPQANLVRRVLSLLIRGEEKNLIKTLNSADMWGGSGAVWEVYGFEKEQDEKEFWRQLIRLTTLMKEIGIKNSHAYSVAEIFKKQCIRPVK